MRKKTVWGIATLIVLLVAGVSYMAVWQYTELQQYKKDAADADKLLAEHNKRKQASGTIGSDVSDANYQLPPLGETDDTGYWEGNTWHQKTTPKPKKKWWQLGDTRKYIEMLVVTGNLPKEFGGDSHGFARWIIAEHPYSQAALEARLVLGDESGDLKEALKYHPNSPLLHAEIAGEMEWHSPEESVAFAKKALRLFSTTSEDYSYRGVGGSPEVQSHYALGFAYQRLGDYKSALVHLKAAQRLYKSGITGEPWDSHLDGYNVCSKYIAAIEAGNPRHKPRPKPTPRVLFNNR